MLLPADTPVYYTISMVLAYGLGIVINFTLQHSITFRMRREDKNARMFTGFVLVAIAGAGVTALVALSLRYLGNFDLLFGTYSGTAAFVAGNIAASVVTYWLNARHVFVPETDPIFPDLR